MSSAVRLEFSRAMSDFKTMFPEMDHDVIEAVLRANNGAVDSTIDQLLAMSTDHQNEKLRTKLEENSTTSSKVELSSQSIFLESADYQKNDSHLNMELSPKAKKYTNMCERLVQNENKKKWNPPLLRPLPEGFLRISNLDTSVTDFDLPDEQFALMLQNEEFMDELRWNTDFMNALEKEQAKAFTNDDVAFKERLKNMGKMSRRKFLQMAKVFTWQRNKKLAKSTRNSDSLPLKEGPSDDEDIVLKKYIK